MPSRRSLRKKAAGKIRSVAGTVSSKAKSAKQRVKNRNESKTERSDFRDAREQAEKDRIREEARKEARKEAREEFRAEEKRRLKQEFKEEEKQRLSEPEQEGRDVVQAVRRFVLSDNSQQRNSAAREAIKEFREFESAIVEEQRERRPSPQADNFGMDSRVGDAGQLNIGPNEFDLDEDNLF